MRPGQPAFVLAALNALMKVVIRLPFTLRFDRLNTHGQMTPSAFSRSCSPFCVSRSLSSALVRGTLLPCLCSPLHATLLSGQGERLPCFLDAATKGRENPSPPDEGPAGCCRSEPDPTRQAGCTICS
jgi:hypothetical protein